MAVPQTSNASDITTVIASLANRQSNRPKAKPLVGPKRAAILMLALGEKYGGKVWSLVDDDEVRELSIHMSTLGTVEAEVGGGSAARIRLADVGLRRADGNVRRHRAAAAAISAGRARGRHHGRNPR